MTQLPVPFRTVLSPKYILSELIIQEYVQSRAIVVAVFRSTFGPNSQPHRLGFSQHCSGWRGLWKHETQKFQDSAIERMLRLSPAQDISLQTQLRGNIVSLYLIRLPSAWVWCIKKEDKQCSFSRRHCVILHAGQHRAELRELTYDGFPRNMDRTLNETGAWSKDSSVSLNETQL